MSKAWNQESETFFKTSPTVFQSISHRCQKRSDGKVYRVLSGRHCLHSEQTHPESCVTMLLLVSVTKKLGRPTLNDAATSSQHWKNLSLTSISQHADYKTAVFWETRARCGSEKRQTQSFYLLMHLLALCLIIMQIRLHEKDVLLLLSDIKFYII